MSRTASDFLLERLIDWGIERIYGYPGDGINGVFGALNRHQDKITFIQARHEEMASFIACAHAKFTDDVGVCIATSGPGAIHLLNGLYDAKLDNMPVVAIVGQQATTALGGDYQQEVDLISLYKDVAGEYVHMASDPSQIRTLVDRALRIAMAERTVTAIILPNDVQEKDAQEAPPREHGSTFTGVGYRHPRVVPQQEDLQQAANLLNEGEKVAMLVGAGALRATEEVMEVAELLGAGVAKALLGKCVIPDELPYCTGPIGLLGSKPSWNLMMECDTLFIVGSSFPYSEFLPKEDHARGVQIDIKPRKLGLRFPTDVNLEGDCRETLQLLIPLLQKKEDRTWRKKIEGDIESWWKLLEERAMEEADPINPQRVFWELSQHLPDDVILTCDSGSAANWYARDIRVRRGMMGSLSGGLATMCPGVPYATAAKFCWPSRPVIAMVGDGAMQMQGNNGLVTISKYWRQWDDPRLMVLVLNNQDLNQVTWEQRVMAGDPKFDASQSIPDFPYAEHARNLGLGGVRVESPDDLAGAFREGLSADRPFVVEVRTDPEVAPLPPHIKFEQAMSYLQAMLKGDPKRAEVLRQAYRDLLGGAKAALS